jgi:hypothetical protein
VPNNVGLTEQEGKSPKSCAYATARDATSVAIAKNLIVMKNKICVLGAKVVKEWNKVERQGDGMRCERRSGRIIVRRKADKVHKVRKVDSKCLTHRQLKERSAARKSKDEPWS